MLLVDKETYFVSRQDVVVRKSPKNSADPMNHLIFGDWLRYEGEMNDDETWALISCRGDDGWIPTEAIQQERVLEVNFVDIGQGDGCHIVTPDDEVILIDAGIGDNMFRFLSWRYNLRSREVAGIEGIPANSNKKPFEIDYAIISHPDEDHYGGFRQVFGSKKLKINRVYHNGIVERKIEKEDKVDGLYYYSKGDLGGFVDGSPKHLWDVENTNAKITTLLKAHKTTNKKYIPVLQAAKDNNSKVKFKSLSSRDKYLDKFNASNDLTLKVLGPITEKISFNGQSKYCLRRLGDEGETKNGHSIVLQLQIGQLKIMLGGDLNTASEDFLLQQYCKTTASPSELEAKVIELERKGNTLSKKEKNELNVAKSTLNYIVSKARKHFEVDITKACHHGSHHFSETFLKSLNTIATVISSGDQESHSHPRPDALGAFGKHSRGNRPLIFSTELARSTPEFVKISKYAETIKSYEAQINATSSQRKKARLKRELEEEHDRVVAKYGMISLRTDGIHTYLAQKLEEPKGKGNKWDIHSLHYNENRKEFEYHQKGGH